MTGFGFSPFDDSSPEDRLNAEAEEYMRQGRYADAASTYADLRRFSPTDLWASLAYASALECADRVPEAEQILEEATANHRRNVHLLRFRRLFFERREDFHRVIASREALANDGLEQEGPPDQLADLFFNQGRYTEAMNELERLVDEDEIDEDAVRASILARLGACLRQEGRLEDARENLLAAIELEPENHWTLAELAETERALGNGETARDRYLEALAANPDDHWCRGHLAQLEFELGDEDRAIALYDEILAAEPKALWALVELAQVISDRDRTRSRELCDAALQLDPSYPWAWAHLGVLARDEGKLKEAYGHFQKALDASPNSTWILHELADTSRLQGHMDEAYTHLSHARSINPFEATTYGHTANLLRYQGRNEEAVANLVKAVELDNEYAWAWRELAELNALRGKAEQANHAYEQACRIEPDEAINDGLQAFLLRCKGQRAAALPFLERAIERQEDYLWAWRELIEYHIHCGDFASGDREAGRALKVLPGHPQLLTLRAECLRALGQRDQAAACTTRAIERERDTPQLWALHAELISEQDPDGAQEAVERALAIDRHVDYELLQAQLFLSRGETIKAGELLDDLLGRSECPPLAWELAAELAERGGHVDDAADLVNRGLAQHPRDLRLTLRQSRLALDRDDSQACDALLDLIDRDREAALPWRELAQLLARGGNRLAARRAAHRCGGRRS